MYYLCGGCCCGELNLDICVFVFTVDEAWQMIVVNHWSPPRGLIWERDDCAAVCGCVRTVVCVCWYMSVCVFVYENVCMWGEGRVCVQ